MTYNTYISPQTYDAYNREHREFVNQKTNILKKYVFMNKSTISKEEETNGKVMGSC
jgi:hypothetical protein